MMPNYTQYIALSSGIASAAVSRPSTSSSAALYPNEGSAASRIRVPVMRAPPSPELEDRIYTQGQAIHISRLPHNIESESIKKVLGKYGKVSEIVVKRGKEKRCSATARFQSPAQAEAAIGKLNGAKWGKLNITVRLDRSEVGSSSSSAGSGSGGSDDSDASGKRSKSKTPLVVNGARGPVYHKKTQDADDSFSEGEGQETHKGMFAARECCLHFELHLCRRSLIRNRTTFLQDFAKSVVSPMRRSQHVRMWYWCNDVLSPLRTLCNIMRV